MRHLVRGRSLSRSPAHRKALLANLAQELFQRKRIRTTLIKAKELRPYAERLVTIAKRGHLAARRLVAEHINRRAVVQSLFDEIAPSYVDRNGGYTRIIRLGNRAGDNAPTCYIELVGFDAVITAAATADQAKEAKKAAHKEAKLKGKARRGAEDAKAEKKAGGGRSKSGDKGPRHVHRKAPAQKAK